MTILFPRHLMPAWYWQFSNGLSKWSRNMFVFGPSQKKIQYCWKRKKCLSVYCQTDDYKGPIPIVLGGGEWVSKRNEQVYSHRTAESCFSSCFVLFLCRYNWKSSYGYLLPITWGNTLFRHRSTNCNNTLFTLYLLIGIFCEGSFISSLSNISVR